MSQMLTAHWKAGLCSVRAVFQIEQFRTVQTNQLYLKCCATKPDIFHLENHLQNPSNNKEIFFFCGLKTS